MTKTRRKITIDELIDERKEYNHLSGISKRLNAIPIPNYQERGPCGTETFRRTYESPVNEHQVYFDLFVKIKDYKYFSITDVREVGKAGGIKDFECIIKYYGWRSKRKYYTTRFDDYLAGLKNQ